MKAGNKTGTILMYNCSNQEFFKMQQIFAMLRLRMRVVKPDRYHLTLAELADGVGEPVEEAPEVIPEKMLVFCGVNQAMFIQLLEVLRTAKIPPIGLKAVLTQENKDWDSLRLYQELKAEREAMSQEKKED